MEQGTGQHDEAQDAQDATAERARGRELHVRAEILPFPVLRLSADGTVAASNGVLERELGLPRDALTGQNLRELLAPDSRPAARALLEGASAWPADGAARSVSLAFAAAPGAAPRPFVVRRDGAARWLIGTASAVQGRGAETEQARHRAEAQTDEYAGISAELVRANQALEEQTRQLRDAATTKSRFLATMSHELRTPLNAVLGYAGLLRDGIYGALGEPQRRAVESIVRRAKDLQLLIDDVLDLAKLDAKRLELRLEDFDPTDVLTEVRDATLAAAGGKELTVVLQHELHRPVRGDRGKYRQALLNLVSNAVKFTPRRGRVELCVGLGTADTFVTTVHDSGIGIAPADLPRIFDRFQQLDTGTTRRYAGIGLGLALARRLVDLMGGTLTAESTPGQGATFTITLPLRPERDAMAAALEDGAADRAATDPVVLAIDDDPEVIALLRDSLTPAHFRVVGALTGERGLEMARILDPLAITLDIMMPDKDGWQVLRELKDDPATRHIPVLIMSIVAERALGFSLGVSDYLVKPVDRQVLLGVLERLRHQRTAHTALVVDDDPDTRTLLRDLLESLGFSVRSSDTAATAGTELAAAAPDVLFLDASLPEKELRTVLDRLGSDEQLREVRTVLLAHAGARERAPAQRVTAGDAALVLEASERPERLLSELRAVLAKVGAPAGR